MVSILLSSVLFLFLLFYSQSVLYIVYNNGEHEAHRRVKPYGLLFG